MNGQRFQISPLWIFAARLAFVWFAGLYAPYAAAQDHPPAAKPLALDAAMAKYRQELATYLQARDTYQAAAKTYWASITEKRRSRNGKRARGAALSIDDYVLDQPPVYSGPPKPRDPSKPSEPAQPPPYVPVVADFLAAAATEFKFTPRMPRNDGEFKRAYVAAAAAAGLSKDQVVRIYSFEATGNGTYELEAGLEYNKNGRAISTALGYNQLLATNSVEILRRSRRAFRRRARGNRAAIAGRRQKALEKKLAIVRKMIAFAKSVPDDWSQHEALASTQKGLAIHALNLDLDFGPLLQTQKLLDSIVFARRKGFARP